MRKFVILAIGIFFSIGWAHGQKVFHSLEEIWTYALENNADNALQQMQVEKAFADQKTAGSSLFPKIKGGISGQHNMNIAATPIPGEIVGRPGEVEFVQFGLPYVYQAGITITKTLIDWQSIYQSKIAKTNTQLKTAEKSLYEQTLKEQVAQLYYATLTAQSVVQNAGKDVLLSDSIFYLTSDRFKEGLIDVLALNQSKINKNNAFERLEQNRAYLRENLFTLKTLLGLPGTDTLILEEKIDIGIPEVIDSLARNDVSLKLYEIQLDLTELERKRALSNFSPKLDFISSWSKIQYQEDFSFSANSSDWLSNSYIGLNLSIPIFSGFANKRQLNSAKISQNIARLNYAEELRKSSIADSILLSNYLSSYKLAQSVKQSLQISDENVQLAYLKYAEGLFSLDNYLSVYEDYLAIENQYYNRLSDYLIDKAEILSRKK
jgi:outer membrane protein TolC